MRVAVVRAQRARRAWHSDDDRVHARAAQLAERVGRAILVVRRESVHVRRERARMADTSGERVSLRQPRASITRRFWPSIARLGDPRSLRLIESVMRGRTPSLLELDDRPAAYERRRPPVHMGESLSDSRPAPLALRARVHPRDLGTQAALGADWYSPIGMEGWSRVVFERERDHSRHVFSLDFLLSRLNEWDLGPRTARRLQRTLRSRIARRVNS